jgi:hypothetical protein
VHPQGALEEATLITWPSPKKVGRPRRAPRRPPPVAQIAWPLGSPVVADDAPCLPPQAVLDTVLVLAIVAGTSFLLLGVNVGLNNLSDWWYHTPKPDWL